MTPVPQVPLPTGEVWVQFPIIAVIVLCFALAFGGLYVFIRWAWGAYQTNKKADLAWREAQNEKREIAQNTRDEKMTGFFLSVSASNAADISDMRAVSDRITKALDALLINYANHDLQAKEIKRLVSDIRDDLARLTKPKE